MDHSTINHVVYSIGLPKEMFVVGGVFAACLCEPKIAKMLGKSIMEVDLFVSASNFKVLKEYEDPFGNATIKIEDKKITIRVNKMYLNFHLGIPSHWKNKDGMLVCDPLPLKHWLKKQKPKCYTDLLEDIPHEIRSKEVVLTPAEKDFKKRCQDFDWWYAYSDSARVYSNGENGYKELVELRDKIGGNAHSIFEEYANK